MSNKFDTCSEKSVLGDVEFPEQWTVFTDPEPGDTNIPPEKQIAEAKMRTKHALVKDDPALTPDVLQSVPEQLTVAGNVWEARKVTPVKCQYDFRRLLSVPPFTTGTRQSPDCAAWGKVAYVFIPVQAKAAGKVTLGMGADSWLQLWINGEKVFDHIGSNMKQPPQIDDYLVNADMKEGINLLVARYISGKVTSMLALAGPRELREGPWPLILNDPLVCEDPAWVKPGLRAEPGGKSTVDIGTRRELFIDEFMIDGLTGDAERRLHNPVPREMVLRLDKAWEAPVKRYFSVIEHEGRVRLYYAGRPPVACLAESADGIHFTRPDLGLFEYEGSRCNNIVWQRGKAGHNFTPFKDTNPAASPEQRFKAIGDHPEGGGLVAYASSDGIHWSMIQEERIITKGAFDSQNLAFWDEQRGQYAEYHRGRKMTAPTQRVRGIMRCTSTDFLNWTEPQLVDYTDDRPEEMYTNAIRPYFRAPHIYIGMPLRFVPRRQKLEKLLCEAHSGLGDGVLISSRDGVLFDRWAEAFIPPGTEPQVWTDRMCEPAWGMLQMSPDELTLYWMERDNTGVRILRRGTLRTDGFVSVHAGAEVGEVITRPFVFSGSQLEVNYRTSATGLIRFELCDESGNHLPGFDMMSSEVLYGNEIAHVVRWYGQDGTASLLGRPVRLRVRLQDADLYSFRFTP